METLSERINLVIQALGMKKTAFAEKLNVSQAFVSQLTTGVGRPSDRTISDICRLFNVSEVWLREGKGEMFLQLQEDRLRTKVFTLAELEQGTPFPDFVAALLKSYYSLDISEKAVVSKLVEKAVDELTKKEMPQADT